MTGANIFFNMGIFSGDIDVKYMQIEDCEFDDYKHVGSFTKAGHPNEIFHYCQNHKTQEYKSWNPRFPFIRSMKTGDIITYHKLGKDGERKHLVYLLLRETFHNITNYDNPLKLMVKLDYYYINNNPIDKTFVNIQDVNGSTIDADLISTADIMS